MKRNRANTVNAGYPSGSGYPQQPSRGYPSQNSGYPSQSGYPSNRQSYSGYNQGQNPYPGQRYPQGGHPPSGYPQSGYPQQGYPGGYYPSQNYPPPSTTRRPNIGDQLTNFARDLAGRVLTQAIVDRVSGRH